MNVFSPEYRQQERLSDLHDRAREIIQSEQGGKIDSKKGAEHQVT